MGGDSRECDEIEREAAETAWGLRTLGIPSYENPWGLSGAPHTLSQSQLVEQIGPMPGTARPDGTPPMLAATAGGRDRPATRRVNIDNPYEEPKGLLLQVVAKANSSRAVWTKRFGFSTVVGFPADLESTELLFTSLLVRATRAMTRARPGTDGFGRGTSTRSFRQSFLTAYASRIGERLDTAAEEVDREMTDSVATTQLLPVLAAREDAVRTAFERQFRTLTHGTPTARNWEGWTSGRAAADQASLHGRPAVDDKPAHR